MKRILVTGGAGFIGSHLCLALLKEGGHVTCLDNFATGDRKNVQALLQHPNFQLIEGDVTAPFFYDVEEIYSLACPASPKSYQLDPVGTAKTSILGTIHVLELARQTGAKVLLASTSEIYGDPEIHPQPESYHGRVNVQGPRSCYDESKRCAETLFYDYHRQFGVRSKVARIFNTYGPNMRPDDGRVISNFIVQALTGSPLDIYGAGKQTRSFCYVSDLVEGLLKLMAQNDQIIGPINLGSEDEVTIEQLALHVIRQTQTQSIISYKLAVVDDPQKRRPQTQLARELLGWSPSTSLEEGLEKTILYFKSV